MRAILSIIISAIVLSTFQPALAKKQTKSATDTKAQKALIAQKKAEQEKRQQELLKRYDRNHDGKLSPDERRLMMKREKQMREREKQMRERKKKQKLRKEKALAHKKALKQQKTRKRKTPATKKASAIKKTPKKKTPPQKSKKQVKKKQTSKTCAGAQEKNATAKKKSSPRRKPTVNQQLINRLKKLTPEQQKKVEQFIRHLDKNEAKKKQPIKKKHDKK